MKGDLGDALTPEQYRRIKTLFFSDASLGSTGVLFPSPSPEKGQAFAVQPL